MLNARWENVNETPEIITKQTIFMDDPPTNHYNPLRAANVTLTNPAEFTHWIDS